MSGSHRKLHRLPQVRVGFGGFRARARRARRVRCSLGDLEGSRSDHLGVCRGRSPRPHMRLWTVKRASEPGGEDFEGTTRCEMSSQKSGWVRRAGTRLVSLSSFRASKQTVEEATATGTAHRISSSEMPSLSKSAPTHRPIKPRSSSVRSLSAYTADAERTKRGRKIDSVPRWVERSLASCECR